MEATLHAPAVRAPAPEPSICTGLLLPQMRIARAPLEAWSNRLRAELAAARAADDPRQRAAAVAPVANNAALVAAHYGDRAAAAALCEGQMRWHHARARASGDPVIAGFALQPWVNLGRLEAIARAWEAARDRFALLPRMAEDDPRALAQAGIGREGWRAAAGTPEQFRDLMLSIYVPDTLKALLMNARFAEARAFAAEGAPACGPALGGLLAEAEVLSACRMGDHAAAVRRAAAERAGARGWRRAVFTLRLAEVLACAGDLAGARQRLAPLAATLARLSPARRADLQVLHVLLRTAGACLEAGLRGEARTLAEGVYQGAGEAGDEVAQIESLRIRVAAAGKREDGGWAGALEALEGETAYPRYRRSGVPAPSRTAYQGLAAEMTALFDAA